MRRVGSCPASLCVLALLATGLAAGLAAAEPPPATRAKVPANGGWTTYRHDAARTGVSTEKIELPLREAWVFRSKYPPRPAWPGPARRDGWHKAENLKPRVIFDWAFHVVADSESVFFGSSADDKVYSLDVRTGEKNWQFYTEGPIRLAPTVADGRVYVGSDDGQVYCLDRRDGKLIWRYRASPREHRVPGNGRIISLWPVRTGVLVDEGVAYFCAGLFPFEGACLCALKARSGEEIWKQTLDFLAPQGYLVASASRLYVPMGRGTPAVFSRENGKHERTLGGSGGAFCLLSGDLLIYGPGKKGTLDVFKTGTKDQLATFPGNQMIVTPRMSYLHSDTELSALDRIRYRELVEERIALAREEEKIKNELKRRGKSVSSERAKTLRDRLVAIRGERSRVAADLNSCVRWKRPCKYPYSLVLAGDVLLAGGAGEVAAMAAADGRTLWSGKVTGRALDLALSGGRVIVSTDQGTLHCFGGK